MTKRKATTLSLFELMTAYPTEADAVRYLERITWGDDPACTRCGVEKITPQREHLGRYWCGGCRHYDGSAITRRLAKRDSSTVSRAPENPKLRIPAEIEKKILYVRREFGLGQLRIKWYLHRRGGVCDVILGGLVQQSTSI